MTRIVKLIVPVSAKTTGAEKDLVLVVERHENKAALQPAKKRLAFLWVHAAGFTKGTLYPLMRRVQARLREQYPEYDIDHVLFDARNHGESARRNEGKYPPFFTWNDHALDMVSVVENLKLKEEYNNLVGVAHSFSGACMYLAELYHPSLFDTMCLMDPVIRPTMDPHLQRLKGPLLTRTLKKRDIWENRAAFEAYVRKNAYYRDMHPEAIEELVKHGVFQKPGGEVTLACTVEQEYIIYLYAPTGIVGAYNALRATTIPVHVVFFENSHMVDVPKVAEPVENMSDMVTVKVIKGEKHLCPLEKPHVLVPEILNMVADKLGTPQSMAQQISKL
ncbi:Alpha/Beta hydrolase protein [Syncephalastrum racemosum]|uniref:Alpha/Beta hydrolase protein n=1 Tax=Syncephalastrum racemosum TaxID=13706 RepID=A0A1X2HGP8_SYNRA|nr:Alpha/Beta hydrolase protein [Syncephalastrum racemosum]